MRAWVNFKGMALTEMCVGVSNDGSVTDDTMCAVRCRVCGVSE